MKNVSVTGRILSYLRPYLKEFPVSGFLLLVSTGIGFLQPLTIQRLTDSGMQAQNIPVLLRCAAVLALLVVVNQLIEFAQTKLFAEVHNRSYHSIFQQVFQKLLRLKKSYFEDKNNAEILSCLQMDVAQVASITDRYTVMVVGNLFRVVSGLAGLMVISWKLTLLVLAMVPLKVVFVKRFSARLESSMDEMIESSRDFSQWFGDNLEGLEEIKLWDIFAAKDKLFQEKLRKMLHLQKHNTLIDAQNTLCETLLEWSVTIALYLAGGILVCSGSLTIGAVFAFVSYSWYVTGPISALLNLKMYFSRISPSAKRLFLFLDMKPEEDSGARRAADRPGYIEFQGVGFSYSDDSIILKDVSFHVGAGEKVAIIGSNGSGKTTILNLLLRFYTPDSGTILLDDTPIQEYSLSAYRSLFSVVSQDPYLFLGNIASNIDLTGQADSDKIAQAITASGVAEYIQRLPEGLKTQIGRNGARLSGGEKQKLAVARALLKDAPIILLDEAASGFDEASSRYLHSKIVNEMAGKTVILVTHHYEDLEGLDRIYRLKDGKLEET